MVDMKAQNFAKNTPQTQIILATGSKNNSRFQSGANTLNSSQTRIKKVSKGNTPVTSIQKISVVMDSPQMRKIGILNKSKSSSMLNNSTSKSQKKLYNNYM
jgi:hypothetical protein